jgi:hypothetical protein
MLSEVLDVSFPQNRLVPTKKSILKSHHLVHNDLYRPIVIIRDGRDVMVSAYCHFLLGTKFTPLRLISEWRKKMPFDDYDNINKNMSDFMRVFSIELKIGGRKSNWAEHVIGSLQVKGALIIKYEDLLLNAAEQLQKAALHLDVDVSPESIESAVFHNSFEQLTNRTQGIEARGTFMRKGVAGDWKEKFDATACKHFDDFAGDLVIRLGYESDHNWN